jgi:5-methyltetrahydrofolate--homocysteine methyltransferase
MPWICTALTEKAAESGLMADVVHLLSLNVDAPLVIDTTDPVVMEIALKHAAGRCLLNSINLEAGEEKARKVLGLARRYNAAVIALTIDESGMARTSKDKLCIARRIYDLAVHEIGLNPASLAFDPLTFTLASGSPETRDAGMHTLEAIPELKRELPGCFTLLGVSNISYGLKESARRVLNSAFLYHAVNAGLDLAILNPAQVQPYATIPKEGRVLAEALIFNRSPQALEDLIAFFSNREAEGEGAISHPLQDLPLPERLRMRILMRERDGLETDLDACVGQGDPAEKSLAAMNVINEVLLPSMQEIGDQFGRGELILPFVLQSAEIMRTATQYLEKHLEKGTSAAKGCIVLATVYGDVHDIGKNLVHTILANNGYDVLDLGKQVPAEKIISEALEQGADAIGLSALLVSTSQQMRLVVAELHRRRADLPVLIGGAAVNEGFADQIRTMDGGQDYPGGVFFCKDAFDAIRVLENQGNAGQPKEPIAHTLGKADDDAGLTSVRGHMALPLQSSRVPEPPFRGAREIREIPLERLFEQLNLPALYRISWGAGKARGEKWAHYQQEFGQRLADMKQVAERTGWLSARALYGYWPCHSDGDAIILYQPDGDNTNELLRFEFPRQPSGAGRCLSDYFLGQDADQPDLVALQMVTLGQPAADHVQGLHKAGQFVESYYAHGLAAQLTEAAAGFVFDQIRQELKLERGQGKRYSWGYPALPDIRQHRLVLQLLPAETVLGIHLTSAGQFYPEYTTAALVVHHPEAEYFSI